MPWVYPFGMNSYQSFSRPIDGQKVWVLINKTNYGEYWYLPFFEYNEKTKGLLDSTYDDNAEVVVSRDLGENSAMSSYDDKNGFNTKIGNNHIVLEPDGRIELLNNSTQVEVEGDAVKCGKQGGSWKTTVQFPELQNLLKDLFTMLSNLKLAAAGNGLTAHLAVPLEQIASLQQQVSSLEAKHCKVN